jgi:hypothetical protein
MWAGTVMKQAKMPQTNSNIYTKLLALSFGKTICINYTDERGISSVKISWYGATMQFITCFW